MLANARVAPVVMLALLLSDCSAPQQRPAPTAVTTEEALALTSPMIDCERKAAFRYDDGRSAISDLAQQIMGVCAVEILNAERAFHLSPNDPDVKGDEFKQAVDIVEEERKGRSAGK